MSAYTGAHVAYLAAQNRKYGRRFVTLPVPEGTTIRKAWRNAEFLVQLHDDNGHDRLSINRTSLAPNRRRWADGITWDELQAIKSAVGFAGRWAVEVYPPDVDVVDVANMRHLWLLSEAPSFAWRGSCGATP